MKQNDIFTKTIGLIGQENFSKISNKNILVFGLGGVGGTVVASLARSGISNFTLVDFDTVNYSNLNRQILFNLSSLGNKKVDEAKKYILSINPSANISTFDFKVDKNLPEMIENNKYDFIIDAIDDVIGKVTIAKYAQKTNTPLIISLGMANRLNPCDVNIIKLNKTTEDPLARKIRYEFKQANIELDKINCIFSKEKPIIKSNSLNSIITVPSSAGLAVCYYVIKYFIEEVK